jgi:hypothetical protein
MKTAMKHADVPFVIDFHTHMLDEELRRSTPAVLATLFMRIGADRIVLGVNYPVGGTDPVSEVKKAVTMSNDDLRMVAAGTAAQLLRIETSLEVAWGRAIATLARRSPARSPCGLRADQGLCWNAPFTVELPGPAHR